MAKLGEVIDVSAGRTIDDVIKDIMEQYNASVCANEDDSMGGHMPPTLREAAEELMRPIEKLAKSIGMPIEVYINKNGWIADIWRNGFKMLHEAIAAYDMRLAASDGVSDDTRAVEAATLANQCGAGAAALIDSVIIEAAGSNPTRPAAVWHKVIGADSPPPTSALPPLRMTERRDPCSADARGEWTDFD